MCGFCRKPVALSEPAIEALNRTYHDGCFQCRSCHCPLAGKQYYNKAGIPLCTDCYQVKSTQPQLRLLNSTQATESPPCFVLMLLFEDMTLYILKLWQLQPLLSLWLLSAAKSNNIETDIICRHFLNMLSFFPQASLELCWACGDAITDNVVRALERAYHVACFTCATCKQQIGEQAFAQGEVGEVYCLEDYYRLI